ncbi:hypothetical protein EJ04DRAFT_446105 [Polyplosphaeria fusca]|uniref:AAA+ ATPase domain-containing protein n=1 Tax=Polyplosphaeria fusca TaxID=682080 RepID=A0A9P4UX56_9PLEO|nr:hypothetical protein EJ04DRAFT_446105 [Polyplosphaeria fusca]
MKVDKLAKAIVSSLTLQADQPERPHGAVALNKDFITLSFDGGKAHVVPWILCQTWSNVESFVKVYYDGESSALDEVNQGKFEVRSRDKGIILPQLWEQVVEPNWVIEVWLLSRIVELLEPIFIETDETEDENIETTYENKVRYTVSYYQKDRWGEHEEFLGKSTYDEPVDFEVSEDLSKVLPVLEEKKVVTSPWSYDEKPRRNQEDGKSGKKPKLGQLDRISQTKLQIHSKYLLNILRSVVEYGSELPSGDVDNLTDGIFDYPYRDLYHYRSELLAYKTSSVGLRNKHSEEFNRHCDVHIDVLLQYLYDQPKIRLHALERLWSRKTPLTTFAGLWLLLKPGEDVYVREYDGSYDAYVVDRVEGGVSEDNSGQLNVNPYLIRVWNMACSGLTILPRSRSLQVPVFDNEKEITSLQIFPVRFLDTTDDSACRTRLIERGKKYFEFSKRPSFLEYTGTGLVEGQKKYKNARVVTEHVSMPWNSDYKTVDDRNWELNYIGIMPGDTIRAPQCECKECVQSSAGKEIYTPKKFSDYVSFFKPNEREKLTDHQYLILSSHMYSFILKDRTYDILDVEGLSAPKISEYAIDRLVMPAKNKATIKAIAKTYTDDKGQEGRFSADFIHGKGEGQIILLHGPPGTGKTLTAESVAEFARRPLLSITAADLGHEPETLERNLLRFFKNANDWDAIVLLDEADVYLERRSMNDLRRNSVVSIFLRALDYFQGILFLTTNRVGHFDEAFMARIHVSIGYERLDDSARFQIWDNLFRKLKDDREQGGLEIKYDYDAKEYVKRSNDVLDLKWNGREIRNAFQTAVALAVFDAKLSNERDANAKAIPELRDTHLKQVVSMSSAFKDYMKSTHEDIDDADLAYKHGIRNDKFQNAGFKS